MLSIFFTARCVNSASIRTDRNSQATSKLGLLLLENNTPLSTTIGRAVHGHPLSILAAQPPTPGVPAKRRAAVADTFEEGGSLLDEQFAWV